MEFKTPEVKEKWLRVVKSLRNPKNTAENPFLKNKYAPLHEVLEYMKEEFGKEDFTIVQETKYEAGAVMVQTQFLSMSGDAISEWSGTENKKDPQGTGSAITYMRRYQLLAICGLVGEADDDGNEGSNRKDPIVMKIEACKSQKDLTALWKTLSKDEQNKYMKAFTKRKGEIE